MPAGQHLPQHNVQPPEILSDLEPMDLEGLEGEKVMECRGDCQTPLQLSGGYGGVSDRASPIDIQVKPQINESPTPYFDLLSNLRS